MNTKFLLCFAIFLFAAITINAQINEGRYLLGGSFSAYSSTNQGSNSLYVNIQLGKVIKDNTVVGIIGSIASSNYTG